MKPSGPTARRADYRIAPCSFADARALVIQHHYARGTANTAVATHALVRVSDGVLVGAAIWMPPTKNAAVRALADSGVAGDWRQVLALSRLVIVPGEPKNAAGMLLSGSRKLLIRNDPRWVLGLTYADTAQGHVGTIYKATGWTEARLVRRPDPVWIDPADGRQVARKSTTSRTQMIEAGYVEHPGKEKIRFFVSLAKVG